VALIGSAPTILQNPPGLVDSHDLVVRVNNYKIIMPSTGSRTDVFYSFFGTSVRKNAKDLMRDGVRLCMSKLPNARLMESDWHRRHGKNAGIDYRYIYDYRAPWWFCDTYVPSLDEFLAKFEVLGRHQPTTGFAALMDLLSFEVTRLYVTGFDFFRSGLHNVDEPWRAKNLDDPIRHLPEAEAQWLARAALDDTRIALDAPLAAML